MHKSVEKIELKEVPNDVNVWNLTIGTFFFQNLSFTKKFSDLFGAFSLLCNATVFVEQYWGVDHDNVPGKMAQNSYEDGVVALFLVICQSINQSINHNFRRSSVTHRRRFVSIFLLPTVALTNVDLLVE